MEQMEHPTCNTKSRAWCLTINNYVEEDVFLLQQCDQFVFQEETGTEGTVHLQCVVKFKNPRSFKSMKKQFPRAHVEKCKNWSASIAYCSKLDTRTGKLWSNVLPPEIKDHFLEHTPKWWQNEILAMITKVPPIREIYWYWEEDGGVGKTTFAKHLCLKHKALYVGGKACDVKFAIASMPVKPNIIIWDIPRSLEMFVSYQGIEEVKNGIFFNSKYESGMCMMNIPHLIIFANFLPDLNKLSLDRWFISKI